jgi:Holliday junction DNA helicase RuvA
MIAWLSGRLRYKATDHLVIDVAGIGYRVAVPLSTYCAIPDKGTDVTLHIHTYVREDALSLFGFLTEAEKDMFLLLLGVSGIGPKLALAILSSISVPDLALTIQDADVSRLCTIPGIGKKTAARMLLEMKDKLKLADRAVPSQFSGHSVRSDDIEDVIVALVNLGYKRQQAEEIVNKVKHDRPGIEVEELIREALSRLLKR